MGYNGRSRSRDLRLHLWHLADALIESSLQKCCKIPINEYNDFGSLGNGLRIASEAIQQQKHRQFNFFQDQVGLYTSFEDHQ